ncbi:hypothetical protein C8Q74DRAFT_587445 [Fomes fomentarius]|nr:hypothetical protein C8Q74DRAFT_587445 [Fomes fomentarius]
MPHKRAKRSVRERKRSESGNDLAPPTAGAAAAKRALESEDVPKSVARVLSAAKTRREFAERRKRKAQGVDVDLDTDGGGEAGRHRKRRKGADGGMRTGDGDGGSGELKIMPGESMAHFNRRVEDSMRHSVRVAVQASATRMRQVRKEEELAAKAGGAHPQSAAAAGKTASHSHAKKRKAKDTSDSDSQSGDDHDDDARSGGRRPTARTAGAAGEKTKKTDKPKEFERVQTSAPKRLNDIVQAPPQLTKLPRKAKKLAAQGGGGLGKGAGEGEGVKSLSEGVRSMAQKATMEEERERVIRLYREMKKGKTAA